MTRDKLIIQVYSRIPYPHHIEDLDTSFENCIRFTWRGVRLRVSETMAVKQVEGNVLTGSNEAILLQQLLKLYYYDRKRKVSSTKEIYERALPVRLLCKSGFDPSVG